MSQNQRFTILAILVLTVLATQAAAHSPSSVVLDYDVGTQILTVTVSHSVSDTATHYVEEIQIQKNGVAYTSRPYTTQDTTSGMEDTFTVDAVAGDVLRVTAICNILGSLVQELTVPGDTTTETTPTDTTSPTNGTTPPPFELTTIIIASVIALGLIVVLFAVFRRR
jgi:hypothetical protein